MKAEICMWWWDSGELALGRRPSIAGVMIKSPELAALLCFLSFLLSPSAAFPACIGPFLHHIDFYGVIYSEQGFCLLCGCNAPHMHCYRNNLIQSAWNPKHQAVHSQKSIWPKPCFFVLPLLDLRAQEIISGWVLPIPLHALSCSHLAALLLGTDRYLWGLVAFQRPLVQLRHGTWTGYECEKGGGCVAPCCVTARPWFHTWRGWLMLDLRSLQLSFSPSSVLIFRCSSLPQTVQWDCFGDLPRNRMREQIRLK